MLIGFKDYDLFISTIKAAKFHFQLKQNFVVPVEIDEIPLQSYRIWFEEDFIDSNADFDCGTVAGLYLKSTQAQSTDKREKNEKRWQNLWVKTSELCNQLRFPVWNEFDA